MGQGLEASSGEALQPYGPVQLPWKLDRPAAKLPGPRSRLPGCVGSAGAANDFRFSPERFEDGGLRYGQGGRDRQGHGRKASRRVTSQGAVHDPAVSDDAQYGWYRDGQ